MEPFTRKVPFSSFRECTPVEGVIGTDSAVCLPLVMSADDKQRSRVRYYLGENHQIVRCFLRFAVFPIVRSNIIIK